MDCHEFENRLSEFLDGELNTDSFSRAFKHLSCCESCGFRYETLVAIRKQIIQATVPPPNPNLWHQIEAVLAKDSVSTSRNTNPLATLKTKDLGRRYWPILMFLAPTIIAIIVWWPKSKSDLPAIAGKDFNDFHSTPNTTSLQPTVTIDFEALLRAAERAPADALGTLTTQFAGQSSTQSLPNASKHFLVSLHDSLPAGVVPTDTRLLRLPQCNCGPGKCKCGPLGCICTACLCQREDGSQILIIDHCETQDFSFGNLVSVTNTSDQKDGAQIDLFQAEKLFAASWVFGHRRRTVFGLKSPEEASTYTQSSIPK